MVQTVKSITLLPGERKMLLEKPLVLSRIFFGVCTFAPQTSWHESQISLGDPSFRSYYIIGGPVNYFEARGEGIFQGDIWVYNRSSENLLYTMTEILV